MFIFWFYRRNQRCLTQSVTSAVHNEQFNLLLKTKIDRRGLTVTKDCPSCVHARCGFINTLRKKTFSKGAVRKDDEYCALCSSAAAAVAIGQTSTPAESLLISSLTGFLLPEMWLLRGPRGGPQNFLGSLSLAIFSGPLINYAIIRPLPRTIRGWRLSSKTWNPTMPPC